MAQLSATEVSALHSWWRAANYLSVGQIYLQDNALLREPLERKHVKQRLLVGAKSHAVTVKWIKRISEAYAELGLDPTLYHVEALLTTTREALKLPREIVDTYVGA